MSAHTCCSSPSTLGLVSTLTVGQGCRCQQAMYLLETVQSKSKNTLISCRAGDNVVLTSDVGRERCCPPLGRPTSCCESLPTRSSCGLCICCLIRSWRCQSPPGKVSDIQDMGINSIPCGTGSVPDRYQLVDNSGSQPHYQDRHCNESSSCGNVRTVCTISIDDWR
jgi:hypothetical protein